MDVHNLCRQRLLNEEMATYGHLSRVADHIKRRDGSQFELLFSISRSPVRQLRCNMVETLAETGDEVAFARILLTRNFRLFNAIGPPPTNLLVAVSSAYDGNPDGAVLGFL